MRIQIRRSKTLTMDGRWWFGIKRWPQSRELREIWTMPRPWFIGFGPVQVRLWPGIPWKEPLAAAVEEAREGKQ